MVKYEDDIHETTEFAILNDGYKPTAEEIKEMAQQLWDIKKKICKKEEDNSYKDKYC